MKCTIVILGATGDLAKKKLIPAIYNLVKHKYMKNFAIVGAARENVSAASILSEAKKNIKKVNPKIWNEIKKRFHYFPADFYDKKKFCTLGDFVRNVEKKHKLPGNRIFYLATMPQHFKVIAEELKTCGLAKEKKNFARAVFEKPFGHDLKSAKDINKHIKKTFKEKQIYRMDHYLGKDLVQNLSVVRFTNTILEPLWNNKFIDHVQIIVSEDFGVKGRGFYYDSYGAMKDVVQNHMLQMLALTAMEQPKNLSENHVRNEKVKVLKKTKFAKEIVLGQYKGYKREKGVNNNSKTETFAALKLSINTKRWKKVPFYFITGKNMKKKLAAIYIQFKKAPCLLFEGICNFTPNYLDMQIQPDEGFYMQMNAKEPGKTNIVPIKMDFCHECTFGPNTPEAYENLLMEVMEGDQSVFIRTDEIEEQWKIVDKILKKKPKVYEYKKGELPNKAKKMINWHLRGK